MGAGTAQRGACLLISGKVRKNMEFVVFAGVLLLLFIFMIVQELIQTKNQEKLFKKYLRENYGKEPPKEYSLERFARLGSYLERHKEEKQLDDITWNDLGMDEVFRRIDRTYSAAGEEYLYYTLRNISCGREALEHLEEVVNWLQGQENIKVRIQLLMKRLGHLGNILSTIIWITWIIWGSVPTVRLCWEICCTFHFSCYCSYSLRWVP